MQGTGYFVVFISFFAFISAQNYCSLGSCQNGRHTMCRFPSSQPASACGAYQSASLTQAEKRAILSRHNQLRAYVASGQEKRGKPGPQLAAKNLGPMTWNNELEQIAQRWANQCSYGHDECRNTKDWYVGQNVAYIGRSDGYRDDSLINMVNAWYDEVKDFDRNLAKSVKFNGPTVGHYTQLVWAKSTHLGCGAVRYKDGQWYKSYLVCNYGPGGNIVGEPVYET